MKIKDVAELTNIGAYSIRFYEKKSLIEIPRDSNGVRDFDELSINRLRWIQCYRRAGLSIKEIHQIIEGNLTLEDFLEILDAAKKRLDDDIEMIKFTQSCLATKRIATLNGEPLSEVTACAPSPDEIDARYKYPQSGE